MERRDFLKTAAAAGLSASSLAAGNAALAQTVPPAPQSSSPSARVQRPQSPDMIYRRLGTTGETVSALGLGGGHIGGQKDPAESIQIIRTAVDRGVTFLDNCWDYSDGLAEVRMGQALRDGYRDKVFLMTKIDGRTADAYNKQLEQSLGRLRSDMIDLVQFHEVIRMEDPDRIFAPGGALEAAVAARQAGKIRYIGFTGHKDPAVHLRMLEMAQKHNFHFDTVQMPINVMDAHFRSFTHQVMPVAIQQGIGVLAMKTLGGGIILQSKTVQPIEALHYVLTQPVSVLIAGMDTMPVLNQAFEAVHTFQPLSGAQVADLLARTAAAASDGKYEVFKTTTHFDGTAQHPQWLG
jgi:aryl-alcohol dehydrogenase-like predicted oxidoreductase